MIKSGLTLRNYRFAQLLTLADTLCERFGLRAIVTLGCGAARQMRGLAAKYAIYGLESKGNLKWCKSRYPFIRWVKFSATGNPSLPIPEQIIRNSIVLVMMPAERFVLKPEWVQILDRFMDLCPVALIASPESRNPAMMKKWKQLVRQRFHTEFYGLTAGGKDQLIKQTHLFVIGNSRLRQLSPHHSQIKVAAILTTFNEEDIIFHAIKRLLDQGIYVYVIDNWSTDSTFSIIKGFENHPYFIGCERFPEHTVRQFHWKALLNRVETVAKTLDADWIMHHDADEIRESPWPDKNLKEAIIYADQMGFNAIDHTVIEFFPTDNGFVSATNHETYFQYFDFGKQPTDFLQIKTWKRTNAPTTLVESGGHVVSFPGIRVFPYKFLIKHYPYRSQAHAVKKFFIDRIPRLDPAEVAQGWHLHYEKFKMNRSFVRQPWDLMLYDPRQFHEKFAVERISGIGADVARVSAFRTFIWRISNVKEAKKRRVFVQSKKKRRNRMKHVSSRRNTRRKMHSRRRWT